MSAESRVPHNAFAIRFNGVYFPTDRGHLAHRLTIVDRALSNHADPKIEFAMTGTLVEGYRVEREDLCSQLELPLDARKRGKAIKGLADYFERKKVVFLRPN